MLRVLHVVGGLSLGGSESFIMNIYRKIDKSLIQFDFVRHNINETSDYEKEVVKLGGHIYNCPMYTGKNHIQYRRWWMDFYKQHTEVTIIHGHVRSTATIYLGLAKKFGRYPIAHSHSTSNGTGINAIIKDLMQFPTRYIAQTCYACSQEAGNWMFGKKRKFEIIPNGIDVSRFRYIKEKRENLRNALGISQNAFVIGHIGRFVEAKNHVFILNVFSEIKKLISNSQLILIGDGELYNEIQEQCKQRQMNGIHFLGSCNNANEYYSAMDCFLFPSKWEGLGIALIEAQANGLKCFISDSVPKEAVVSEDVTIIPLIEPAEFWAKEIIKGVNAGYDRDNEYEKIEKSCYNVLHTVTKLTNDYLCFHDEVERKRN